MEAMAMELPVIVTDAGGVRELVEDHREGIFTEPEKPEAIAEAFLFLMNHPQEAEQMGQAGRQKIVSQFHSQKSAEILMKAVETCKNETRAN